MSRLIKFAAVFLIFFCVGVWGYNKLDDRRYIDTVKKLELPTVADKSITFEEITRALLHGEPKWDRKGNCVTAEYNNIKMMFPYNSNDKDIIVQYEDIFLITDKGDAYRLVDIYAIALNEYLKKNIKDIM